jgi:hypothetical protein
LTPDATTAATKTCRLTKTLATPLDAKCLEASSAKTSAEDVEKINVECMACLGMFRPKTGELHTCEAVLDDATNKVEGCAAYKTGVKKCFYCADGKALTNETTCADWGTADNVGCVSTEDTCAKCNVVHGYYAVSHTGKKCAKPPTTPSGSFAKILAASALVIMMMFNF